MLAMTLNAMPGARARRTQAQPNADDAVVDGFGDEWTRFDQSKLSDVELEAMFQTYFHIFPWADLPPDPVGLDVGCGSGRWARLVAPRVGTLHCVDASEDALAVARANLKSANNCVFHHASIDDMPIAKGEMDFGYCLGVLHHIPDTEAGLMACTEKLKAGAPFLVYLYYAFDNRPAWFKLIWRMSDFVRRIVAIAPHPIRFALSQVLATVVYWPLARSATLAEQMGANVRNWPLSDYRRRSFYTMRTDALDRFGTRLEKRFTRGQIEAMMGRAGLSDIRFSETPSYWCAVGIRQ
jgi:SAM-dependent methyltransferase